MGQRQSKDDEADGNNELFMISIQGMIRNYSNGINGTTTTANMHDNLYRRLLACTKLDSQCINAAHKLDGRGSAYVQMIRAVSHPQQSPVRITVKAYMDQTEKFLESDG